MSLPAPAYKPSPLGFGTPRTSPFRRPESPATPSPLRFSTVGTPSPTPSPTPSKLSPTPSKLSPTPSKLSPTPSKLSPTPSGLSTPTGTLKMPFINNAAKVAAAGGDGTPGSRESWTPKGRVGSAAENFQASPPLASSPHRQQPAAAAGPFSGAAKHAPTKSIGQVNALGQLQPAQVRMLRDGFGILDRDGDGVVNREDVADMLTQLGLPANASNTTSFFPPGAPQTFTLPAFLNSLAGALAALSPGPELLSAFSAFDDDDSGQVDLAELRDALMHTAPEAGERALTESEVDRALAGFTGRRAFTKSAMTMGGHGLGSVNTKRGDVFRYQEFVGSVMGSNNGSDSNSGDGSEE